MKKKTIASLCVIGGLLFISSITFANELKEVLELYLQDPSFDLCGREFDKILFNKINSVSEAKEFADTEFIAKLKFIVDDIKTIPLQAKCLNKIASQNALIYLPLTGLSTLKSAMGAKEFSKMMLKLFKLIFR